MWIEVHYGQNTFIIIECSTLTTFDKKCFKNVWKGESHNVTQTQDYRTVVEALINLLFCLITIVGKKNIKLCIFFIQSTSKYVYVGVPYHLSLSYKALFECIHIFIVI